ncbi:hypothetical protein GDO78_006966 [Eleutherodactylus coqui]|uniref:DNA excision repair protein ERCC-6-like 2 n=1 Tax=Eleutherodactylus coqui TaxID=57060 RepID=A0A8J6FFJ7_ELECQ|nr:hypothetical protein GDO78_006966 [Eleutherodactylus coqui]
MPSGILLQQVRLRTLIPRLASHVDEICQKYRPHGTANPSLRRRFPGHSMSFFFPVAAALFSMGVPSATEKRAAKPLKNRRLSAAGLWQPDARCLAPYSEDGELREAIIKSVGHIDAVVSFSDATEKTVPVSRLCKVSTSWNSSMFDDEDLEKPHFQGKKPSSPAEDFPLSEAGVCIPYTINRYLRDYQREGVRFLYDHYVRSTGCILGDDMGLGKTVQVFLIVSPLSVLFNWRDELETWGYFKLTVIHGNRKDFELVRLRQGKYEIALTTYETLRLCLDDLNSIEWSAVIVDEVHKIKNPKARVTEVMKALRCKIRIGLTGTILQNNMEELWCVMDWAVPGCLGGRTQFIEEYSHPIELGQRHNATKRELATGRKVMQKLALKMSSLFLRRTKALISSQLPRKEDRTVYCSLSEFQKAIYQAVLETPDLRLVLRGGERCSCNSGKRRRNCCYKETPHGESVKTLYFSYLAILRKVANHAALLQSDSSTSKKQEYHIQRICSEVFSKFPEFVQQSKEAAFETISDPKYSGKMKVLQQLLNHCRKNKDKILLFSFSTKLLGVLERYCMATGLEYRRLDGATKAEDRVKIVKEFNSMQDVNICLVSTMAGGLGLNFVGANVVVVFDPTWNPANDLQAIDRAYRIGQCRDVKVLRLISLGTVEEIIYLRQVYKQQLHCATIGNENAKRYFKAVQGSKEHKGELFGVHNLFKLRIEGTCLTRDILEKLRPPVQGDRISHAGARSGIRPCPQHCGTSTYPSRSSSGLLFSSLRMHAEACRRKYGVAEVAYIHSNQNVVGSSKAENRMSRWAVRDVFEFNQFSQLPANITAPALEKCNLANKDGLSQQGSMETPEDTSQQMSPVVHKEKKVLRSGDTMFVLGSTPEVVRKRHFSQMVAFFKMASAEELAHHLVSIKSHVRQAMLREYYARRYSEVEDLYPNKILLTKNERKESKSKVKNNVIKMKRNKSIVLSPNYTNKETEPVDFDISDDCELKTEINPTKKNHLPDMRNTEPSLSMSMEKSSNYHESKQSLHTDLKITESSTSFSKEINDVTEDHLLKHKNLPRKMKRDLVSDLLGDTSILDDLFTSQSNHRSAVLPMPSQGEPATTKPRRHSKDFWDILSEQNDESINRLTDLSVIKKACETSILPSVSKKDSSNDSLWVKNEKFLWRKKENAQD